MINKIKKKLFSQQSIWSISIYDGISPINIRESDFSINPVLTAKDVSDLNARFVADPFIIQENNKWYMFFEVLDDINDIGRIGVATSDNGYKWSYNKVVLSEEFHLSYPYVFKDKDKIYMIPECGNSGYIKIYEATEFPFEWKLKKNIIKGRYWDSSILNHDNIWWIFTNKESNLHLFYSENLLENWKEHPMSPIISNNRKECRPAGRIIKYKDKIIRYSQDCSEYYGKCIRTYSIEKLNTNEYKEVNLNIDYKPSNEKGKWNKDGMHSIDLCKKNDGEWLAAMDGHYFKMENRMLRTLKCKLFSK